MRLRRSMVVGTGQPQAVVKGDARSRVASRTTRRIATRLNAFSDASTGALPAIRGPLFASRWPTCSPLGPVGPASDSSVSVLWRAGRLVPTLSGAIGEASKTVPERCRRHRRCFATSVRVVRRSNRCFTGARITPTRCRPSPDDREGRFFRVAKREARAELPATIAADARVASLAVAYRGTRSTITHP